MVPSFFSETSLFLFFGHKFRTELVNASLSRTRSRSKEILRHRSRLFTPINMDRSSVIHFYTMFRLTRGPFDRPVTIIFFSLIKEEFRRLMEMRFRVHGYVRKSVSKCVCVSVFFEEN